MHVLPTLVELLVLVSYTEMQQKEMSRGQFIPDGPIILRWYLSCTLQEIQSFLRGLYNYY